MSYDVVTEAVPKFNRRMGDQVVQGSNNSLLVLGTDRTAGPGTGLGHLGAPDGGRKAGCIHLVVGRNGTDPNMDTDSAFVYLSMKTEADKNLGLSPVGQPNSAVLAKADSVRIVSRKDVKISMAGGKGYILLKQDSIIIEGDIRLGEKAQENLVRGPAFRRLFNTHIHPTAVGPSGRSVQQMDDSHLSSRCFVY